MITERKLLISSCLVSAHLEILDSGVLPLEQALKLQVRLGSSRKDIEKNDMNNELLKDTCVGRQPLRPNHPCLREGSL